MALTSDSMSINDLDDPESPPSSPGEIRAWLSEFLDQQLKRTIPDDDPILRCDNALLHVLPIRPKEVLREAHRALYAKQANDVDESWLRLFEEASLHVVLSVLSSQPLNDGNDTLKFWLAEIVALLDRAIIIAGAPGRRSVIDFLFEELEPLAQQCNHASKPQLFDNTPPPALIKPHPILRSSTHFTTSDFKAHLLSSPTPQPIILPGLMSTWPALQLWQDVSYLKHRTMSGLRLVPIEIGASYTSPDWTQKLVTFGHFADTYLGPFSTPTSSDAGGHSSPSTENKIAYLAQHNLLTQLPRLADDLVPPTLLTVIPPAPTGPALLTPGLDVSLPHTGSPARTNAWLGPAGTKSPLHTDPWHNLFCQVVGWKYIRLYPPKARESLYPRSPDDGEDGVDAGNTSRIDVQLLRPAFRRPSSPDDEAREVQRRRARERQAREFPRAEEAQYVEGWLGPGETLYVPLGWWHYVESGSASFSVSFWWI